MRPYLQLIRAPLAATAVANAWVAGALGGGDAPLQAWVLLGLASAALYWAGMALNDVFDRERDAHLYPKRPLPSGAIGVGVAATLGAGLLLAGVGLATAAGLLAGRGLLGLWASALTALWILLYDGLLKRWRHPGCFAMAACRAANAGLGLAVLGGSLGAPLALGYAGALFLYVYGLTVVSTYEDEEAPRAILAAAGALLLGLPIAGAAWALTYGGPAEPPRKWAALGCMLLLAVVWSQLVDLFVHGTRARGQSAVRTLLHALWALDLSAALLGAPWLVFAPLAALYAASRLAVRVLFRPPPPPAPEPA
ncbi:MAG: UbiA family prenyltransferase [Planctomycetes bacterium]|nr:UbiA family prenyltransferase [Planctomycetota bacterium]